MILITGAGGFIGRFLCFKLFNMGQYVVPLYHATNSRLSNLRWECDLTNMEHLLEMKSATKIPDTVVHLAGHVEIVLHAEPNKLYAPPLPGNRNVSKIYNTNIGSTANILEFCLCTGVKHLIFASSQSVYGMPQSCPLTEETPCKPLEHYAMSKLCCEQILQLGAKHGLAITILRFPGVFSEERRSGVVFKFCKQAVYRGQINVSAEYPLPIDVIHMDDIIDAITKTVCYGGQKGLLCLNIATGEPCSLSLLAEAVASLVPGCKVKHSEALQPIVQMDPKRAEVELEWKAQPQSVRISGMLKSV